jgi:hypothetical protein
MFCKNDDEKFEILWLSAVETVSCLSLAGSDETEPVEGHLESRSMAARLGNP